MYLVIRIAGDPTSWWTESFTDANARAAELASSPANVAVFYPVKGNLLISKGASVAILDVPPTVCWIPSGVQAPVATLYVQAAPAADFYGYTLPAGTNLDALQTQVTTATTGQRAITPPASSTMRS